VALRRGHDAPGLGRFEIAFFRGVGLCKLPREKGAAKLARCGPTMADAILRSDSIESLYFIRVIKAAGNAPRISTPEAISKMVPLRPYRERDAQGERFLR
jgi:hypothetical protein